MRIRSAILWLLPALSLLSPNMNAYGFRIVRSQHHKRMVLPENIYADFVAITDDSGKDSAGLAADIGAAADGGNIGSAFNPQECAPKCDAKQIITPGDPKQKGSCIAVKAAQDAKAANEAQQAAGQLAAQHIKQELAEKAFQSAKAAEAALTGKQMLLQQLEEEVQEAHVVVQEETTALHNTEANMNAALEAAQAATQHYEMLTALQKAVKDNLANIQTVALGSQQEMTTKVQLLDAAKLRLATLQKQLQGARDDYEKTKQAAYKAACAAVEAKQKASSNSYRALRNRRQRFRPEVT